METAIALPLLLLLIFGLIEFGWLFYQMQDVRQGAREGARRAAVEETASVSALVGQTCDRMSEADGDTSVSFSRSGNPIVGSDGVIIVTRDVSTLTGLLDPILDRDGDGFRRITSDVDFRIEEPVVWSNGNGSC